MHFSKRLSTLLILASLISLATKATAQVSEEMLFRLCSPFPFMGLEVFIQETGEPRILTEESIRRSAEYELRKARVLADNNAPPMTPSLRVSLVKHNEAYSANIAYRRFLRGIHEDKWMKHAVWNITRVGTAYSEQPVLTSVLQELNVFLSEFSFTQNSPECHEWNSQLRE